MIRNAPVTCLSNLHTAYPEPDRRLTHLAAVEIIGPHQQRDFFSRTVIEYQPNSFMHMFQQPDEGLLQHQMSLYQSLLLGLPIRTSSNDPLMCTCGQQGDCLVIIV